MTRVVRKIGKEQEGVVLIEALLARPVRTSFTRGFLLLGTLMRLRDAARCKLCRPVPNTPFGLRVLTFGHLLRDGLIPGAPFFDTPACAVSFVSEDAKDCRGRC